MQCSLASFGSERHLENEKQQHESQKQHSPIPARPPVLSSMPQPVRRNVVKAVIARADRAFTTRDNVQNPGEAVPILSTAEDGNNRSSLDTPPKEEVNDQNSSSQIVGNVIDGLENTGSNGTGCFQGFGSSSTKQQNSEFIRQSSDLDPSKDGDKRSQEIGIHKRRRLRFAASVRRYPCVFHCFEDPTQNLTRWCGDRQQYVSRLK